VQLHDDAPVALQLAMQFVLNATSTHALIFPVQGYGAARMLSNSFGPVFGGFRPSSDGNRQSWCPAKPLPMFKSRRAGKIAWRKQLDYQGDALAHPDSTIRSQRCAHLGFLCERRGGEQQQRQASSENTL
jgi:hypothetical protein